MKKFNSTFIPIHDDTLENEENYDDIDDFEFCSLHLISVKDSWRELRDFGVGRKNAKIKKPQSNGRKVIY